MWGVYSRLIKDRWKSLAVYTVSSLALAEMYVALYPTLKDAFASMDQLLQSFPAGFMEAFGFNAADLSFATIEHLLATEMFTFMWPIIAIIMAVSLAAYCIVGDIERGTIEIVLAQPVSRFRILFGRVLGSLTILTTFAFASTFGIILLELAHNIEYNLGGYLYMAILGSMFSFAVFGVALFFSALFSEKGKATFGTVGVLILMYAINIVSGLKDSLKDLQYVSFFHYLDAGAALVDKTFVDYTIWMYLGVGAVGIFLAMIRFMTRDITT